MTFGSPRWRLPALLAWTWFALVAISHAANPTTVVPEGVSRRPHNGWPDCYFLSAPDPAITAVVAPAVGGRILYYSANIESILHEQPGSSGKTLASEKGPFLVGGYQLDVGPDLRDIPDHLDLSLGPWNPATPRDYTVSVASPTNTTLRLQLGKEFTIDPESGALGLSQWIKNTSDRDITHSLWDRTACRSGGYVLLPLNPRSRFPAGWSLRLPQDDPASYDGKTPDSPSVRILNGVLVAKTPGAITRLGADTDAGWVAYVRNRLLFVKQFPHDPRGNYSQGGNTVEIYFDAQVTSLEPLSPEITVKPGDTYTFPEQWTLIALEKSVTSFEQARAAVKKIPRSPFAPRQSR